MSLIEYHNLKYKVSEKINWITERRRLLYICKPCLPDGCEDEDIQDVLSLLDKLEEENRLAIDSLAVLKDLLKQLGEWNLLQLVKKFENKRKEYKRLLEQCGRVLGECSQLERLISVCEGKISDDRQAHITDVFKLFTELEQQNNLGITRLEMLKTMATELEKPNLLKQVEEFETRREQEEDAERKQNELEEARRRSQAQTVAVLASARDAGERLIGIVTPHCTFRNVAGGIVVVTTWMILRRSSSLEEFVNSFTEAVLPAANTLRAISEGSLCFTVQAETTSALEALWGRFQDGTLQRNLQQFLVTDEIKQLADGGVILTVQMDEKEYKNALLDLMIIRETKEKRRLRDRASSDSELYFHSRVRETTLESWESREDVLEDAEINAFIRSTFVEKYVANLPDTFSVTTESVDSGVRSERAPSEYEFDQDAGSSQQLKTVVEASTALQAGVKVEESGLTKRIWRAMKKAWDGPRARRKEVLRTLQTTSEKDFSYDVFIIYSSRDRDWVALRLLPIIEGDYGFKCLFHQRDFEPGKPIIENIAHAVTDSRSTIAVISHNFIASNWCQFELNLALSEHIERGTNRAIAIKIDDVSTSHSPRSLQVVDYSSLVTAKDWYTKVIKALL